ncbi:hypothetical protein K437DRAFT_259213 [Tilletiaria anomala UBC 951]|uniref:tRNA (guanine-N(7)-)-methyltransferase n=1 Tax=Tilletiaria anomala (strain ATCC 24038 / CBS 436.72 / UBC 951) TaxID=1037660 RepID=A0A066VC17_TILAU|nr:uncharacterized protein K437DRAFT_259213 [Tilletiaria anomala UBC 951]KDN39011.1 hypothetical protein K437DRAFT_259213 [Tilletiaria anomala UBC 951]
MTEQQLEIEGNGAVGDAAAATNSYTPEAQVGFHHPRNLSHVARRKAGDELRRSEHERDKAHFLREQVKQHHAHLNVKAGGKIVIPQKKWYRQRAHANPFSDHMLTYPAHPAAMDWSEHFPDFLLPPHSPETNPSQPPRLSQPVCFADIGCGFGGLLMDLAPLFPDTLMVGMEIRQQVADYVVHKVRALRLAARSEHVPEAHPTDSDASAAPLELSSEEDQRKGSKRERSDAAAPSGKVSGARKATKRAKGGTPASSINQDEAPEGGGEDDENERTANEALVRGASDVPGGYKNVSALRANCMKFLPNFFHKAQLTKMFFLFPDPHFKARKHKARIVSPTLLAEYAYVLAPGGILYTITDVEDLHRWMVSHLDAFPLFERMDNDGQELQQDPCVPIIRDSTEEGKKVARNGGRKFFAAFKRREDPPYGEEVEPRVSEYAS